MQFVRKVGEFFKVLKVISVFSFCIYCSAVDFVCDNVFVRSARCISSSDLEIITFLDVEFVCCGCDVLDCD